MSEISTRWGWLLGIAMSSTSALWANSAFTQITPDGTLPNNSKITIEGQTFNITGGSQAGKNLFHSFQEFSVHTGSTAFFNNSTDIQNIISRVTGGSVSNIDGLIRANGNANLFLINPNGIIFGKNASLKIGGSFLASTASSLKFADGTEFSAKTPQNTPLLTISIPTGLQYGVNPGSIQVQGDGQGLRSTTDLIDTTTGLRVQPDQTLALVGGDVILEGATLKTAGGRIELGSVGSNSLVSFTPINKGFSLSYDTVQNFGKIQLSQQAAVDASGLGGGDIQVWGQRIILTNGSQIEASTLGEQPGGAIFVNAKELVEVSGFPSGLVANTYPSSTGRGGNLIVNTRQLLVQDGAQLGSGSGTDATGKSGNLIINATDSVRVIGTNSALSTQTQGAGNAGDLKINTQQLLIQDSASVNASTFSSSLGGNLTVNANKVQLIGTNSNLSTQTQSAGNAGDLKINTQQLLIQDGAFVSAGTFSSGLGGNLTVNANKVQLIGTNSALTTETVGAGNAGDLKINTQQLLIQDGAFVSAGTFSSGLGGNVTVNADRVQVIGRSADGQFSSKLTAQTDPGATGDAGSLTINARELQILDGGKVTVSSTGVGVAGNLNITARSVQLDTGNILAQTDSGNGGNLMLDIADLLLMRRGSKISTNAGTAQQPGDGGNITINAPSGFIIANPRESNRISANSANSRGGKVRINAQGIFGTQPRQVTSDQTSDITATGASPQLNGTVELNTPDIDPNSGLVELPKVPVNTEVVQGCYTPRYAQSSFVITGRGGLPPNPKDILTPNVAQIDWVSAKPSNHNLSLPPVSTKSNISTPKRIVEATAAVLNAQGQIVLTANPSTVTPDTNRQNFIECHGK